MFVSFIHDRHADPEIKLFRDRGEAVDYAYSEYCKACGHYKVVPVMYAEFEADVLTGTFCIEDCCEWRVFEHKVKTREDLVLSFHEKHKVSPTTQWSPISEDSLLAKFGKELASWAECLEAFIDDPRALRAHLIAEEFAELINAEDEVGAFDAICDMQYVLSGTAATFDWPLEEGFLEVHRSNMTKQRKSDDPGRIRDKGPNYEAPKLKEILDAYRS